MRRLLGVLLVVALCGCGAGKIKVDSHHDPDAEFASLRTYAWIPGPQRRTGDPRVDDPFIDTRVRQAVEAELAARGYSKAFTRDADFLVAYHAALKDKLDTSTMNTYYGYARNWGDVGRGRGWNIGGPVTYSRSYDVGTLVLDIAEPGKRWLIWRAAAQAEIGRKDDRKKRDKRLSEVIRRMLDQFPPQ